MRAELDGPAAPLLPPGQTRLLSWLGRHSPRRVRGGEVDRWLELCAELATVHPHGPRVLHALLRHGPATLERMIEPSEEIGNAAPFLWLPRRNGAARARALLDEILERTTAPEPIARVVSGAARQRSSEPLPVVHRAPDLLALGLRAPLPERGDRGPSRPWSEIDLTDSLRDFELWLLGERRRRIEEITLRALGRDTDPLTLERASPERARRTLQDAVGLFNEGRLDLALFELDVAASLLARTSLDPVKRRAMLLGAQRRVDRVRLDMMVAQPAIHPRLRQFIACFPEWSVDALIDRLGLEPDRRERRRLLDLLIVHGADTRRTASSLLLEEAMADRSLFPWYVTRNLLFLLRRLIERDDDPSEIELMSVLGFADLRRPPQVVTEAVGYLSRVGDPRSEGRLLGILEQLGRGRAPADTGRRLERALLERLLRMPSARARVEAVRFLIDRCRDEPAYLGLLGTLGSEELRQYPQIAVVLRQALEQERGRGWRRLLLAPRRGAALRQTLETVLSRGGALRR